MFNQKNESSFCRVACAVLLAAVVSGCSHAPTHPSSAIEPDNKIAHVTEENLGPSKEPKADMAVTSAGDITIHGLKLKNTQFDFPVTVNSHVEYWIDYFTKRGRKHFARYLERSELFIPFIAPLLKQNGLPEDLVYLAMIESGFNNHAHSAAKAVGPWQFISATGKRYGMMVNWWVDERRDTRKSTLSAVGYLRDLYQMFGSWELAAAAYNAGEAKVARAIRRYGSNDFWVISRQRYLRPETRDYVPKIIAAAIISKNRTQFGFPASTIKADKDEAISGDGEVVKVEKESDTHSLTPPPASETLASILEDEDQVSADDDDEPVQNSALLPGDIQAPVVAAGQKEPSTEPVPLARPVPTPQVSKKGEVSGEQLAEFEVQSPADLMKIARASGLAYHTVKELNPEVLRWCTPPTVSTYKIKLPASAKEKFLSNYNRADFQRKVQFLSYKARKGESLVRIAQNFGIRVDPMADLNGISSKVPLRSGVRILLPIPNDRSRSLASLDIHDPSEARRSRRSRRGRRHTSDYRVSYKKREAARSRRTAATDQG